MKEELDITASTEQILDCLRERTGLIIGPGTWEFVHNTIAEYLVAKTVDEGDKRDGDGNRIDRLYLLDRHTDDRWNTIIFLMSGITPKIDLEDFIGKCLEKDNWKL